MVRSLLPSLALLFACGAPSPPGAEPASPASRAEGAERASRDAPPAEEVASLPPVLAEGPPPLAPRFIDLSEAECLARVAELGLPVQSAPFDDVRGGLVIAGPVGGVDWAFTGRREVHKIMDCRLVLALHAWAPTLREAGVVRVRHLSALRPNARVRSTGARSGHAAGLAVDPRFFDLEDGTVLDVLHGWEWRERGADPCTANVSEAHGSAAMRRFACDAIATQLFQLVLTPHFDDAHANHLHIELSPVPGMAFYR